MRACRNKLQISVVLALWGPKLLGPDQKQALDDVAILEADPESFPQQFVATSNCRKNEMASIVGHFGNCVKGKLAKLWTPPQILFLFFQIMKTMYSTCNLIHADLSEYNILWHCNKIWIIDVSQSVEPTHCNAMEFLLRDCTNVLKVRLTILRP